MMRRPIITQRGIMVDSGFPAGLIHPLSDAARQHHCPIVASEIVLGIVMYELAL